MIARFAIACFICVWVPYASLVLYGRPPGNPENTPYAGQPGSFYDAKANPPQVNGVVTYDPNTPVAPPSQSAGGAGPGAAAPADNSMPMSGAGMMQGQ